jgi:hypothetical protein
MPRRLPLLLVLALSTHLEAAPTRKLYADPANGVTFTYPAGWLLNGDDDAATAKLRIVSQSQPDAVVQLEGNFAGEGPYKGTDFESGAFAYIVTPGGTEEACLATLDRIAEGAQRSTPAVWSGLPARKLEATYTVAGTDDIHRTVAIFRNDRCYLFETAIIRRSADTVARPLPAASWTQIFSAFDMVLRSVRIAAIAKD